MRIGQLQYNILHALYMKPRAPEKLGTSTCHHAAAGYHWLRQRVHFMHDHGSQPQRQFAAAFSRALRQLEEHDLLLITTPAPGAGSLFYAPQVNPDPDDRNYEEDGYFTWQWPYALHPDRMAPADYDEWFDESMPKPKKIVALGPKGAEVFLARLKSKRR